MEKLINEKDYLTNEVNRLEDKVNQLIKSNQESEQFYHNLIVDKENELTRLRNFLSQLTDCHQKMKSCNNNGTCDQHHPDLMEMLRSNSDPSLSCNQKSKGDKLCFRVDVSTQTIDSDYGLTGLDNQLFIPTKLGFACLNYDQLPPPPPESLLLPPQSSQLIKNEQQSESTISRETLEGINQILLAHALGQLTVADADDEEEMMRMKMMMMTMKMMIYFKNVMQSSTRMFY
ncbi:uncharacterized protein LOC128391651 [Panonychus citri]|uniref:uncharacterized protein LOC128391651 n=1 Tax=Panonychus citri TaxID=50023 RepID=UPI0023079C96|nr:uncharacterized protein LOC128391651 [Panonychus citri]